MSATEIARNYAEALFRLGHQANANDAIQDELEQLAKGAKTTPLGTFWHHPLVAKSEKQAVADKVTAGYHPYMKNLVRVLIQRNRTDHLPAIAVEFSRARERMGRQLHATILTRFELSAQQREQIQQRLAHLSGRTVRLTVEQDPSIIAGIRLVIHDKLLDGTVDARLNAMRKSLLGSLTSQA
ncbi:MAG TPA: ATP synthase F1 subunit delta [Candidatus Bipolaricaulota bacterium]